MPGLIHVYKGDGKGKTTASVGLCIRAAGTGMKVVFLQFHKGNPSGEINILNKLENVKVIRNDIDFGFFSTLSEVDKTSLVCMQNSNLDMALEIIKRGECQMIIMDEIFTALNYKSVDEGKIKALLENKPEGLEIILTGHNPDKYYIDIADYVTNMTKEKHPYDRGILAREGIEK